MLHQKAPAFNKVFVLTLRTTAATGLSWLPGQNKSADLSTMTVTSGWHYKVISLTHITWNVSINGRTKIIPVKVEHLFTAARYQETFASMQIHFSRHV